MTIIPSDAPLAFTPDPDLAPQDAQPMHADPHDAQDDPHRAQQRALRTWPILLLAAPAFVAIWSGWVGLGQMTGFGPVRLLPGIADQVTINTAITLPIGVECYAAYALFAWLSGRIRSDRTRRYARNSAFAGLTLGAAGQVGYHLMSAAGVTSAPWPVTVLVACLPVAILGMGAALGHLVHADAHADSQRAQPMHRPDQVRIAAAREVHSETHSTATELTAIRTGPQVAHSDRVTMRNTDRWAEVAVTLCAGDPSGRRDPNAVAAILRLRHEHGWPHARIASDVGVSSSTVSRVLAATRELID
ncbi:helix-turn-helix domain-containing protein [Nocardia sp. CA2R105]|uniref:helix-turn-helix domain-containing protein n=1 Tax=Nocardia coffeae TaxID=2873381 RepID=UPI001CA6BB46|nr:helix-turn-helix domain-containing protein [Nocardia coffeae]MBY8858593.1 helix-turn-helix domain-containing protein [Nocardia coffeae]